jgi:hypothetical protein
MNETRAVPVAVRLSLYWAPRVHLRDTHTT